MFYEFEFFIPSDFLELSNELLEKLDNFDCGISALKRTIYSRAYYSSFLHVREWLLHRGIYVSTVKDHSEIPDFLRLHGPFDSAKNMEIASEMELLKKLRHQADYYIKKEDASRYNSVWVDGSVEDALSMADDIIHSFK